MLVIPLFQENRYIMDGYSGHYTFGSLRYYYHDDSWEMREHDNCLYTNITGKIRRPWWPRELSSWGLEFGWRDRYKGIFWRRASRWPKRQGPRWFRCLMMKDRRVLVRDFMFGGYRKRCELPITPNWWRRWNIYEPVSCKRTWPKEDIREYHLWNGHTRKYDRNRSGISHIGSQYSLDFDRELAASFRYKAGYPIEHEGMYFTPSYYYLEVPSNDQTYEFISLYASFYTVQDGKAKLISMRGVPDSDTIFWNRETLYTPSPKNSVKNYTLTTGFHLQHSLPKKPDMDLLTRILRSVPIEKLRQL